MEEKQAKRTPFDFIANDEVTWADVVARIPKDEEACVIGAMRMIWGELKGINEKLERLVGVSGNP